MLTLPPSDARSQATRAAYREACRLLGYAGPNAEADDVIDLLGVNDDGTRSARFAEFYPLALTAAIDRAARLARRNPEALLPVNDLALLDLLAREVIR